ncbi:ATP-binding protein [Sphingomonas sp. JC676]|uniref:sensor histidine kinase n=1 Tax=Sphingomonas sp. JC676 TaxID=2768065 RepID=UPI0016585F7B|nr:ATP-binding protein [Sphingomonas sp. JC676]MBC9032894.1 ATP-binding protein [Sphingomonas sp. JC676]
MVFDATDHGPPGRKDGAGRPNGFSTMSVAGTVHDLGNLIQIAASAINIVARAPDMPAIHSGPVLARAMASLDQAGAIVRQTIGDIRDRARCVVETDVAACLVDVAMLIEGIGEPGLTLEIDAEPKLPILPCDPVGLRRAVLNLVFNARDAVAGTGIVSIQARTIWRGAVAAGVEINVADNGLGMSPAIVARAFDPFFTTKRDGLGGIGLPMVERFVRDAGGEIAIESELGIGTIVTLRLPATAPTAETDPTGRTEFNREESDR